jgi:hypothetical protein
LLFADPGIKTTISEGFGRKNTLLMRKKTNLKINGVHSKRRAIMIWTINLNLLQVRKN